jgi:hypothetical protein
MAVRIRIGIAMRATKTSLVNIRALLPASPPVDYVAVDPVEECPVWNRQGQFRARPLAAAYPATGTDGHIDGS